MKKVLIILSFLAFSIAQAQSDLIVTAEINKISRTYCKKAEITSANLYIVPTFKYKKSNIKVRIELLKDNGEYGYGKSKVVKGDTLIYRATGLKFRSYTYRFYAYPDNGKSRNFNKVPENSWVEKTFKVTRICKDKK